MYFYYIREQHTSPRYQSEESRKKILMGYKIFIHGVISFGIKEKAFHDLLIWQLLLYRALFCVSSKSKAKQVFSNELDVNS